MKKLSAKFLCVVLSLVVLLCALPVTVYAEGTNVFYVESAEELTSVCSEINQNGGTYTINLTRDIENGCIDIKKKDAVVTVNGNNHTIFNDRTAVYVSDGAKVVLGAKVILGGDNSTLTLKGSGNSISGTTNDNPGLIHVLPGSECEMNANVTLKDHKGENYLGSGVTVQGGTFIMNGGTIENCGIDGGSVCYGGGVAVLSNGTFIMDDGVITECYVNSNYINDSDPNRCFTAMGGGVFVTAGSVFTMNGGTISNCKATNFGGGVAMVMLATGTSNSEYSQMGMGNPQSIVTINGGTITGNSADNGAGVFASGYFYSYAGGVAYTLPESGSTAQPGLYINGSTISNNKADDMGGGVLAVCLKKPKKAQIKNTTIKDNTAAQGAGVEIYGYWTETHIEGCTITGNNATASGGGISLDQGLENGTIPGKTYLKDTVVTNNTSGKIGAGVIYNSASNLMISGANTIQNNTYNGKLNNLNILDKDYPVYVDGALDNSKIGLSDPTLWNDDKEDIDADAVSTIRLTEGYKANNASLIPADAFTSDHESWVVDYGEKKTEQGAEIGRTYTYSADKYTKIKDLTEGYPVLKSGSAQYIAFGASTFTKYANAAGDIYKELVKRFNNEYENIGDGPYVDYGWDQQVYFDSRTNLYITVLSNKRYSVYVFSGTNKDDVSWTEYNAGDLWSAGGVQNYGGEDAGVVKMELKDIPFDDGSAFKNTPDETNIQLEFDQPLNFGDGSTYEIPFVNDIGVVTGKYVINKSSEKVDTQYDTVTTDYTNEVRLVRKKPDYHINNDEIDDNYNNNDIFTSYVETAIGKEIKVGETIGSFYTIPEVKASKQDSCPYIFKGWYYDPENDNDDHPVKFGTDKYAKDIYAHWIKVEGVAKDDADEKGLPQGYAQYGGFDLAGIQISEGIRDTNFGEHKKPGGLRFITSLSMDVVNKIKALQPGNNIEYGYVAATNTDWIKYHKGAGTKLQYVSEKANGINTSGTATKEENYFDFASNINCTSKRCSSSGVVKDDHRNFGGYLLYTLVITYEGAGDAMRGTNVLARPYIHYTDANGLERVAYSEYRGNFNTIGGCYISYNDMH